MDELQFRLLELSAKGYCCSQIMIILGLDNMEIENPQLVHAMGGLCMGNEICGVLSGAACLISLYAGKGEEHDKTTLMLQELRSWFKEHACSMYQGITCEDILGEIPSAPDMEKCGQLVTETYAKVMDILVAEGIDPSGELHG